MIRRFSCLCALLALALCAARSQVMINEIVAANDSGLADENGDFSDWFELYNASDTAVNLDGWGVTDNPRWPFEWVMRDLILPPHGFVTIFFGQRSATQRRRRIGAEPNSRPSIVAGGR